MAGYRILSVPDSVIFHWGGFSLEPDTFQRLYLKHRNSFVMLLKNWSLPYLFKTVPIRLALECLTALAILKGDWKRAAAAIAGAGWVVCHPFDIIRRRRESQAVRHVPDREIARTMLGDSVVISYFIRGQKTASDVLGASGGTE